MKRIAMFLICCWITAIAANAMDLSKASSQDLLGVYGQLRAIQGGDRIAVTENVRFKRDSAAFTFVTGRITFAAPIADRVLAAHFEGEGVFELSPPATIDQRQIARFAGSPKLTDTFTEAIFYFTDDTYAEMEKLMKVTASPGANPTLFASSQKQFAQDFNDWIDNQRKGFPAMRNMAARMLADLADGSSRGFFLASFKAKKSGNLLFHISWNRDSLLLPAYPKGEEVMLLHLSPGNYYEWWAGFHLASEYARLPRPDHYTPRVHCPSAFIDLRIHGGNEISAAVELDYVVNDGSPRVLPFYLNGVLRISKIQDGAGKPVAFIQEARNHDSDPWLILAEPARAGEKYKVQIEYREDSSRDSALIQQQGSGPYYVVSGARNSWFPSFNAANDRTLFEIQARSPKKFKFIASGELVKSEKEKDAWLTRWKSNTQYSTTGFAYGDFFEANQESENLKVSVYSGRNTPYEFVPRQAQNDLANPSSGISRSPNLTNIRGYFPTELIAKRGINLTFPAFQFMEYLFGPLPYKSASVGEQAIMNGGQSWPSVVLLPFTVFVESATRNAVLMGAAPEERDFARTITTHEIAHQWVGHLVGWKTYHDQWLPEAISDFASIMYLNRSDRREANDFWKTRRYSLLKKNSLGYRPIDSGPVWLNQQLNEYNAWDNNRIINYKGVYIIEMLRAIMYDPRLQNPDGRFIAMMREFVSSFSGQNASTEDFRRIVDKNNGQSMEWFFDQWVYGTEFPTYDFSYQISDAGKGETEVAITLTQSGVSDLFFMQLPLYVEIKGERKHVGLIGVTGTKTLKTSVKLPMKPDKVLLDPEGSIFAEIHQ